MQRVEKSIRVGAPVGEVYQFWRNFENFPQFMEHVKEVKSIGGTRWHWVLEGPMGARVEYDARLAQDEPNKGIGWNSEGGTIETTGAVTFNQITPNETEVHVTVQWYDAPGGAFGDALARIFSDPERMIEEDLRRFKGMVEGRPANVFPR